MTLVYNGCERPPEILTPEASPEPELHCWRGDDPLGPWLAEMGYNKWKLLGAPGIATRSKDATRGSWPYY